VEAVAPTLTGDGCGVEEVMELVDVTCIGVVVVFIEVVEEEAGATEVVAVDDWHPMSAGRHSTKIIRTAKNFFTSSSL